MSKLYFVRHGESEWNVAMKICGATDIPLTDKGHQQAILTGRNIKDSGIYADEILCSPLCRASETARHISEITGIPFRVEERLREQNFGRYEATRRGSDEFKEALTHFTTWYDGGESMLHLAQRIYNLLDELKEQADQKTYILVAHNGIARVVQSYFQDMTNTEFAAYGVNNCTVSAYTFEDAIKIQEK